MQVTPASAFTNSEMSTSRMRSPSGALPWPLLPWCQRAAHSGPRHRRASSRKIHRCRSSPAAPARSDYRCSSTPSSGAGTPAPRRASPSIRTAPPVEPTAASQRRSCVVEMPTYSVLPICITSPPSSVPGASITNRSRYRAIAFARLSVSPAATPPLGASRWRSHPARSRDLRQTRSLETRRAQAA